MKLPRGRRGALAAGAAVICVCAPVLILVDAPPGLRFAAVLALFCVGPGAAVLPFDRPRSQALEGGLVVGTSLAVAAVSAQLLLWLGWEPRTATVVLSVMCLAGLAAGTLTARAD